MLGGAGGPAIDFEFVVAPSLTIFKAGALKKAQTIEGAVGANPARCHSERSEESLRGFAYSKDRDREILRFAQNDTQGGVRPFVLNVGWPILDGFQGWRH